MVRPQAVARYLQPHPTPPKYVLQTVLGHGSLSWCTRPMSTADHAGLPIGTTAETTDDSTAVPVQVQARSDRSGPSQRAQTVVTTMNPHTVDISMPSDAGDGLNADWAALKSGELMAWIALRRVNEGGMALLEGAFYHHGCAVPCYLNAPLAELVETGQLRLAEVDTGAAEMRQVMFTENGREWYEVLCGSVVSLPTPRSTHFLAPPIRCPEK